MSNGKRFRNYGDSTGLHRNLSAGSRSAGAMLPSKRSRPAARRATRACQPCPICPSCQSAARICPCAVGQITRMLSRIPPRQEGRYGEIVTKREAGCGGRGSVGRDDLAGRVQARERFNRARKTNGADAYGKVVWSWHPLLMSSRVEASSAQPGDEMPFNPSDDGGKKELVTGESAKETVKTIAWGMPDVSGASAVNTGVHTYYPIAHTRLRVHWAPGIPRALCCSKGDEISGKARARRAAGTRMFAPSLPATNAKRLRKGELATKQSMHRICVAMDCFADARNDGASTEVAV
jgi:hypothetical protein